MTRSATEIIGDSVQRCTGWTHTCLPCDSTWIGKREHVCTHAAEWRRNFWIGRLRWAMPTATHEEVAALIARPITRTRLVELLGERWKDENGA